MKNYIILSYFFLSPALSKASDFYDPVKGSVPKKSDYKKVSDHQQSQNPTKSPQEEDSLLPKKKRFKFFQ